MRSSKEKLYIVIPAYNEKDNLIQVVNDWYPVVEKVRGNSKLIIIDDDSKDNTYEIMCEMAKARPMFGPLTKSNGGHGATVLYGYKYAIEQGAPVDYNLPNIMMTTYFAYYHERLIFRKISFKSRQSRTNTINIKRILQK